MLETPKLDSFRVMIPIDKLTIIEPRLSAEFVKYYPELDITDEEIQTAKPLAAVTDTGISSRYYVKSYVAGGISEKVVVIQLNAKMLKSKYLQGISMSTINAVYDFIIAENIVYVDFRTFINSFVADVDICIDYKLPVDSAIEVVKRLKSKTLDAKYISQIYTSEDSGVGFAYNMREKATPSKPHVKLYHKTLELTYKSKEFASAYLSGSEYSNLFRLEYTVKNSKQRKRLTNKNGINLQYSSLKELLELDTSVLKAAVLSGIPNYIYKREVMKKPQGMKATDIILLNAFNRLIELGEGRISIQNFAEEIEEPAHRSRWKKRINNLLDLTDKKEVLEKSTEVENFFSKIL